MARGSSKNWLQRQKRDPFVKQARKDGWRSRAVFKLEQIDKRDNLLRPGLLVADLGCAPGGWSQYALKKMQGRGRVFGIDLLDIEPLRGLQFLQASFVSEEAQEWLGTHIASEKLDLVLSDMAPNLSGNRLLDQSRMMDMLESANAFCRQWLKPGGQFLFKAFQGEDLPEFVQTLKAEYGEVLWRKPQASRDASREVYVLARERRMPDNLS